MWSDTVATYEDEMSDADESYSKFNVNRNELVFQIRPNHKSRGYLAIESNDIVYITEFYYKPKSKNVYYQIGMHSDQNLSEMLYKIDVSDAKPPQVNASSLLGHCSQYTTKLGRYVTMDVPETLNLTKSLNRLDNPETVLLEIQYLIYPDL